MSTELIVLLFVLVILIVIILNVSLLYTKTHRPALYKKIVECLFLLMIFNQAEHNTIIV